MVQHKREDYLEIGRMMLLNQNFDFKKWIASCKRDFILKTLPFYLGCKGFFGY